MKAADYVRLVALAAIWGGVFIFMRVSAPVLGPGIAAMSQLAAALLILPAAPFFLPETAPSLLVTANLLALGLLCGAVGILWGMLFLGETLPPGALAGAVLILAGTVLVTRG